jgi:hypothetical protein
MCRFIYIYIVDKLNIMSLLVFFEIPRNMASLFCG